MNRLETVRAQVAGLKRESIYQRRMAASGYPFSSKLEQDPILIAQEMAYDKVLHLFNLGDVNPGEPVLSIRDQFDRADRAATAAVRDYHEGLESDRVATVPVAVPVARQTTTRPSSGSATWPWSDTGAPPVGLPGMEYDGDPKRLVRRLETRNKQPNGQWNEWITFELNECPELPDDSLDHIWHELQSGWDKVSLRATGEAVQYRLPRH